MELRQYKITAEQVREYFEKSLSRFGENSELRALFNVAVESEDFALFPYISANLRTFEEYIDSWVEIYFQYRSRTPYDYRVKPKAVTDDMSVVKIVAAAHGLSEEQAMSWLEARNAYMLAESAQGYLLEEYVAIAAREHGLLYASGILRAIDFCSSDGEFLLQIKNKNNSEKSPTVKTGKPVKMWYRVNFRREKGAVIYYNNWEKLNAMFSAISGRECTFSEEGFLAFIGNVVGANKKII